MIAILIPVLVASLLGSLHCAAMCGPFVAFYSGTETRSGWVLSPHLAYNLARLLGYATLGFVAGVVGQAVDLAGRAAGLSRLAAIVAGAAMVLWGLMLLLQLHGVRLGSPSQGSGLTRLLTAWLAKTSGCCAVVRALLLGIASGLLPCGWLYAFALTAAGTGSPLGGAAVMGAFWLGTVPLMLGLGVGLQRIGTRVRQQAPTIVAVALLCVGLWNVLHRLNVPADAWSAIRPWVAAENQPSPDAACPYH